MQNREERSIYIFTFIEKESHWKVFTRRGRNDLVL